MRGRLCACESAGKGEGEKGERVRDGERAEKATESERVCMNMLTRNVCTAVLSHEDSDAHAHWTACLCCVLRCALPL